MHLDPRLLMHLAAVVEYGSFSRAAAALGVTQPAISRSVGLLERRLGAQLLERGRNGARPTELGSVLAAYSREVHRLIDRAKEEVRAHRAGTEGVLRIGGTPTTMIEIVPRAIDLLLRGRPKIVVKGQAEVMGTLLDELGKGALDIVVGPVGGVAHDHEVRCLPLVDCRLAVIAGEHHRLVGASRVEPKDLVTESWVLSGAGGTFRRTTDVILSTLNIAPLRPPTEVEWLPSLIWLIETGRYIGILPVEAIGSRARIVSLPLDLGWVRWQIGVFYRPDSDRFRLAEAIIDCLKEAVTGPLTSVCSTGGGD